MTDVREIVADVAGDFRSAFSPLLRHDALWLADDILRALDRAGYAIVKRTVTDPGAAAMKDGEL